MNDIVRLIRVANKLPLFAGTILRNYVRIYTFQERDYVKMENRRIKVLDNQGIDQPVCEFDETGGITWDNKKLQYTSLVNVVFEETYRFQQLHVSLKFITHIRKNNFTRSVVFIPDNGDKVITGTAATNLCFMTDPFISYKIMNTFVKNMEKCEIPYGIEYREILGMVLLVYHNKQHFEFRTLINDKTNKLAIIGHEDTPLTTSQALASIRRQRK